MATDDEREVYRQRCESYRFHYKLEWQFLQVGVAIGLITLGLGEKAFNPYWWQFFISGVVFLGFSYAMQRVSKAITDSRPSFIKYARIVGDCRVGKVVSWYSSAAVWGRLILHYSGVILVVWSFCKIDAIFGWFEVLIIDIGIIGLTAWSTRQTLSKDNFCAKETLILVGVLLIPIAFIMGLAWHHDGVWGKIFSTGKKIRPRAASGNEVQRWSSKASP